MSSIEHISLRLVGVGPMLMRNSRLGDAAGNGQQRIGGLAAFDGLIEQARQGLRG